MSERRESRSSLGGRGGGRGRGKQISCVVLATLRGLGRDAPRGWPWEEEEAREDKPVRRTLGQAHFSRVLC